MRTETNGFGRSVLDVRPGSTCRPAFCVGGSQK
jgi:hypothetical protein